MTVESSAEVGVFVGDDTLRQQLVRELVDGGFTTAEASRSEAGLRLLRETPLKVVICAHNLPDGDCAELCATIRQDASLTPCHVIVLAPEGSTQPAQDVLAAGADDYLSLPADREELLARVRLGVRVWTMHNRLRRAAITDGLTALYNHDHFNRLLEMEMARSRRYGHSLALVMMDVDHFKSVNDTFGHLVGNNTLEEVARVLRTNVRDIDAVARFGGEEFAIILPEGTAADAKQVAERVRVGLAETIQIDALHSHPVTASFGLADGDDPRVGSAADLVDLADRALYVAKQRGRNVVVSAYEVDEGAELAATLQTGEIDWLRRRVQALSVRAKDVYVQSVSALLQALDEKDPYTARHAVNVGFYAQRIAEQMGCSKATVKSVYNAGLLHDVGKVGVPDRILMKRAPLTQLDRMVLEQVPLIGTRIVDHLRILESEVQIIRHQREYYDGSGLPAGLKGNQIPVGSRILLVADAFDAMSTDRVYRERRPLELVLQEIQSLAGKQFDPRSVTALRQVVARHRDVIQQRIEETIQALRMPTELRQAEARAPWPSEPRT